MVAAVLGTLFGPLVANRYLTIKQLFVVGELAMGVELALVSIFNYLGLESCLLVCIMLFTFTYQSNQEKWRQITFERFHSLECADSLVGRERP